MSDYKHTLNLLATDFPMKGDLAKQAATVASKLYAAFLGSDAEQIVRLAPTPVLLVRASEVAPMATAATATAAVTKTR